MDPCSFSHLSHSNFQHSSIATHVFQNKNKSPTASYKVVQELFSPFSSLISFLPTFPTVHCAPATLFFLLLSSARPTHASGLYMCFPLYLKCSFPACPHSSFSLHHYLTLFSNAILYSALNHPIYFIF